MNLNKQKLKELMEKGIIKSVWSSREVENGGRDNKVVTIDNLQDINIFKPCTISIQQGYNYSALRPQDYVCVISVADSKMHYQISVPSGNLKDLLEMLEWDFSFSNVDTAKMFNKLMMGSNRIERVHNATQNLVSKGYALTEYHSRDLSKFYYTIFGTNIDDKQKFRTIEEVFEAVNKAPVSSVSKSKNSEQEPEM